MAYDLNTPVQYVKGVGPRRAADLRRVGIQTAEDLLYRFPVRYEDRGRLEPIGALRVGMTATIEGEVVGCGVRSTRRPGFKIFELLARDDTGAIRAVWLNQPFLRDVFAPGQRIVLFGTLEMTPRGAGVQLTNPQYEILDADDQQTIHAGRIVPIYEKVGLLSAKFQRKLVHDVLAGLNQELPDPLPIELRGRLGLPARREALGAAHFPPQREPIARLNEFRSPAQYRLIFEEFFLFQLGLALRKHNVLEERKPFRIVVDERVREAARRVLPFHLTASQREALKEIVDDMQSSRPMNRLLHGDVGAGKTIVALLAAVVALENALQVAFMAPTDILAEQHAVSVRQVLGAAGYGVALLRGATRSKERRTVLARITEGEPLIVVGTHALIQEGVAFKRLGLAVVDEQHRFGVLQRASLIAKGYHPDVLVMTATPIPRTLALTAYGDLDVSVLRELPPGRRPIKTILKSEVKREEVYRFLRHQMDAGRQIYVVYPLIEESEKIDLKAAAAMRDHLAQDVFPEYRLALLHGRLKTDEKDAIMRRFVAHEIDLLVATTVVEVGVDVPNATIMLIEHAERFGLSQLHQLRGRVGRGAHQSHCVLLYQYPMSQEGKARLKAIAESADGFEIAERDLELRGPGDFFGTRQSGLPTLRIGQLLRDADILEQARKEAFAYVEQVAGGRAGRDALLDHVRRTWSTRFGLVSVG